MSELDDRYVYRGVWLDQTGGSTMGRTITVDTNTSVIIVALLAIMSTIGATHLWSLLLFSFHQQRASGGSKDALFQQQQALLRTMPAPGNFVTEMIKLWWSWRRKGRVLLRCLLPALFSLLFAASTLTASVFSSAIVSSSDIQVLVDSPFCGFRNATRYLNEHGSFENDYVSTYESIGETYALDCYIKSDTSRSRCNNIFVKPRIPVTIEEAECPFSAKICATKNFSAIVMDSGLLDMNEHFGFNLGVNDGVKFRRRTTCSVLPPDGYLTIINSSDLSREDKLLYLSQPRYDFSEEQFEATLYGGFVSGNGTKWFNATSKLDQATEIRSLLYTNSTRNYRADGWMKLGSDPFPCTDDDYCWTPVPEISQKESDLVLMVVTIGQIRYQQPVEDPLFAAHTVYNFTTGKNTSFKREQKLTIATVSDDQWKIEAISQDSKVWAVLQILLADYAIGAQATEPHAYEYVDKPATAAEQSLCHAMRMKKSGGFA
ncbi:uncharacterized protein N0V89_001280 [Didymosphaeria variabile]|uniref:Uncharacterized protein n=1 Tax=Didymosphaeria variabile TaxID=1932322 RepID=A0A9W8XWV0_9PLEO|nr:uncharacterized protein N0V89_001280 [Didymosphaeria variabile]KAJ4360713.1 hypothetical protein N0V89_001280 [Didymosphaeria variabile]